MKTTAAVLIAIFSASLAQAADQAQDPNALLQKVTSTEVTDGQVTELLRVAARSLKSDAADMASSTMSSLASTQRKKDVFGAWIIEPVESTIVATQTDRAIQDRRSAAVNAVKALKIVGVSAERGECYIGQWIIRQGDNLTVRHSNQTFTFAVSSVSGDTVTFLDSDSKCRIVAHLNIVPQINPPEMTPIQ